MRVLDVDISAAHDVALTVAVPRGLLGQGLPPSAFTLSPRDASVPVVAESLGQRATLALVFDTATTADTRRARSAASELMLMLPHDIRVVLPGLIVGAGDPATASRAMEKLLPQDDGQVLRSLESLQSLFAKSPAEQKALVIFSSNRTSAQELWASRAVAADLIRSMDVRVAAVNVADSGRLSSPFTPYEVARADGAEVTEALRPIAARLSGTYVVRARLPAGSRPESVTVALEAGGMRALAVVRLPPEADPEPPNRGLVLAAVLALALVGAGAWAYARRSSS
jgi:hypothetical protein